MLDIKQAIVNCGRRLSKSQRLIAEYVTQLTQNPERYGFDIDALTAGKLAVLVGVSESTVVRFAEKLGYESYPQLRRAIQDAVRAKLTSVQRIEAFKEKGKAAHTNESLENLLDTVLKSDLDNIRRTLQNLDRETFRQAAEALNNAERIFIVGSRTSAALALFFGYYCNIMFDNVKILTETAGGVGVPEQILSVGKTGDTVIGISFPRYSQRTVRALQFAKSKGAKVIALTDAVSSPLKAVSDICIYAKGDMVSFADSLVAPLSVINALIASVAGARQDDISARFAELENIWSDSNVYE
ncbi:MAG: MurR/RpiR family transcriptional regulator [Oscillospiraceae bacterium]|nr:MurR/RpiR family transcriptional regulator [Oscillospiraceae bacterium]